MCIVKTEILKTFLNKQYFDVACHLQIYLNVVCHLQMSKYMYKNTRYLFIQKLYVGFFQTFDSLKVWKKLTYNF